MQNNYHMKFIHNYVSTITYFRVPCETNMSYQPRVSPPDGMLKKSHHVGSDVPPNITIKEMNGRFSWGMDFKAASFGNLILHPPYFEYAEKSFHVKHLMPMHRRTCQPIKAAVTIMACEVLNGPSYTSEHDRRLPAYTIKRQCLVLRQPK